MSGMFVYVDNSGGPNLKFHLPLRVAYKVITLWTGPTQCRYFTRENLPDVVKQKLAMISTLEYPNTGNYMWTGHRPSTVDKLDFMEKQHERLRSAAYYASLNDCPDEFKDVGWRVNDKYYYIVLTEKELLPMTMQAEEWVQS